MRETGDLPCPGPPSWPLLPALLLPILQKLSLSPREALWDSRTIFRGKNTYPPRTEIMSPRKKKKKFCCDCTRPQCRLPACSMFSGVTFICSFRVGVTVWNRGCRPQTQPLDRFSLTSQPCLSRLKCSPSLSLPPAQAAPAPCRIPQAAHTSLPRPALPALFPLTPLGRSQPKPRALPTSTLHAAGKISRRSRGGAIPSPARGVHNGTQKM